MKAYLATPDSGTAEYEKVGAAAGLAVLLAALTLPLDRLNVLLCPIRAVLGIPCVLCGGTRGFLAAARFDLAAAWGWNPLSLVLFLGLLLYLPYALGAVTFSWPRLRLRLETRAERNLARALILSALAANWTILLLRRG